jgi:transcription initiation factor TFIID TATA-box-binding protein
MVKTTIVNVVATAYLGREIDLYDLEKFKEMQHDPEIYGGRVAYFKLPTMKGRVSIFPSGKMISVGTKSEKEASHELALAQKFLISKRLVKPARLIPKTQNLVATAELEINVNLEKLAEMSKVIYEPEQFLGGILRIEKPHRATILVFASGKAVIAGLTSTNQLKSVAQELETTIKTNDR